MLLLAESLEPCVDQLGCLSNFDYAKLCNLRALVNLSTSHWRSRVEMFLCLITRKSCAGKVRIPIFASFS